MDTRDELDEIIEKPMNDSEIKHYLPNTPLITYPELGNYNSLEELLPENKSYVIILYQDSPNKGHWVCVLRYDDKFEYFDSYGNKIDDPLNWVPLGIRKELDQMTPYLSNMLKGKKYVWNNKKFQEENPEVATCGRHCVFRILNNEENNLNLKEYIKVMEEIKKNTKLNYDEIVSEYVDLI
jgi:hypothetical protein